MQFADFLLPGRVCAGVVVQDREELIGRLSELLCQPQDDADQRALIHRALLARERLGSTGIGQGIAVPHGRSETLDRPRAAFMQLAKPVDFNASDHTPVDLVAALVVPAHFTDEHLQLLAGLAEAFSDPDWCHDLREATDAGELRVLLSRGQSS